MKKFIKKLMSKREGYDALKSMAKPMILGIDFDGTCVRDSYPDVGDDMPGAGQTLRALTVRGHRLILWTCREGELLEQAVRWFEEREIPLFGVNGTPIEADFRPNGGRKIFADLYIDDRNFGGFPGWQKIHQELLGMPLLA